MNQEWTPTREWEGRTVVVIGTGPSLSPAQLRIVGLARQADRCRVIALKDSVLLAWWADMLFAADASYWKRRDGWTGFPGRRVGLADSPNPPYGLKLLRRSGYEGFDDRPGFVCTHRNSGAMATQLAGQLGAGKIVLLAFDMKAGEAGRHWFGENEWGPPKNADMARWVEHFRAIAAGLAGKLVTATPGSALDFVPYIDLAEALQ